MAEIAKINKVNIYRESLGDNQIDYELVQDNVPIGTDINIEPTLNSGSFLLKGADTTDGSIQFGTTNGITATAEGGLIANSITANKLILENGNNDIDIKNALKSVSLTQITDDSGSFSGLAITGTTLNGDKTASSSASITFPEGIDEKVKVTAFTGSTKKQLPILIGASGNYTGSLYSIPTSIGYYDSSNKNLFLNHLTASKISGNAGSSLSFQNISCQSMSAGNFTGGTAYINLTIGENLEMTNINADIINAGRLKSGGILFSDNAVQVGQSPVGEGVFSHTWRDETTEEYGILLFKELHSSIGVIGHDNCDGHQRCLIYIVCKRGDTIIGTDFLVEMFDLYLDNQAIGEKKPLMITDSDNEKYLRGCGLPFKQLYSFYSKEGDNIYFNLAASNGNSLGGKYIQVGDRYHTSVVYYD